ncbi:polysaccharide lyase 6 family protein, partial [Bacteroidota bacterium]
AETPGEVVFSGNSSLTIAGDYIEVHGILFANGNSESKPVISFRSGDRVANHCRVSSCAISYYNPSDRFIKTNWVELHGQYNQVDHCSFVGKLNAGVTLAVLLNGKENQENHHRIEYNFFGERPRLGSNGGETMRVGTSTFSLTSSNTKILNNYFNKCSGEVEIISIKACDNTISGNTFYECEGILTLRHGNNNTIQDNVFIGNNVPNTGGVRVINAGHNISNNHFQELAGHRFRSAFAVMNGVPNSAINRYHQVKDATFDNNVFINCENIAFGIGSDNERTAVPQNSSFRNNIIYNPDSDKLITELDDMSGISYMGNTYNIKSKIGKKGFESKAMRFEKDENGLYVNTDYKITPQARKDNTGAAWYQKDKAAVSSPERHEVSAGDNLNEITIAASAGDIIVLREDILLNEPLLINKPLIFLGEKQDARNAELKYKSNRDHLPLMIIQNGGELRMKNIDINGASESGVANIGISTQKEPSIEHYNLFVDQCSFYNFSEGRASAFQAFKSTFADSIVFTNCTFHTISGFAINLKAENEDLGKYNAEYVIMENCLFYNVMGSALDLYRGGNDESTTGPSLLIDHCTFHNIENKELGSAINLTGVQEVQITNNVFSESGKSGRVIRMEDQQWIKCLVDNNSFYNCGRFESFYDNRMGKNNYYLDPSFVSVENADFTLGSTSPLLKRSTNKMAIGFNNELIGE